MPAINPFEGYIRPRVCGLIVERERLLLVKINAPTRREPFWMPPGGGIGFQEPAKTAVVRECAEETGLRVEAGELCFVSEYISGRWHALEWYFRCKIITEETHQIPKLGHDPEMQPEDQMLEDIAWFTGDEIRNPQHKVFPAFIREYAAEILSGQALPLRYCPQ
ncbi:MAG: NUDIX domain-containing protein [Cyclonatronaceae bacterium]